MSTVSGKPIGDLVEQYGEQGLLNIVAVGHDENGDLVDYVQRSAILTLLELKAKLRDDEHTQAECQELRCAIDHNPCRTREERH